MEAAHPLNSDISADEVLAALRQLKNGKSLCMDGLPAREMLKYACPRKGCTPILGINPVATATCHLLLHVAYSHRFRLSTAR